MSTTNRGATGAAPAIPTTMKAVRLHAQNGRGGPEALVYEDAPTPRPGEGEVLVRVHATGVIRSELTWPETYKTATGTARTRPIPGHDLSGVVATVGPGVVDVAVGTAVYALTAFDRDGAEAEYAIAVPAEVVPKPRSLDHRQAAAVPLAALTAWQGLFDHAHLGAGQTVLIHGAAGGVGVFAVQLAHWAGAHVIGTASACNRDVLRRLGADEVIDYTATRFEDVVHEVDVVFDAVGGETEERSWAVLKKGGILVSIVTPPPAERARAQGVRSAWFIVVPHREQLIRIGGLIDDGQVRPIVDTALPLAQARQAFEQGLQGHTRGKIVLIVVDEASSG